MLNTFNSRDRDEDPELGIPLYNTSGSHSGTSSRRSSPRRSSPRRSSPRRSSPRPSISVSRSPAWSYLPNYNFSPKTIVIIFLSLWTVYSFFHPRAVDTPLPISSISYDGGFPRSSLTHLILVAGHAIWKGGPTLGVDEAEWALLPYQHNSTATFIKHIEAGARLASSDPNSLLVFSGGETRGLAGPLSEAQGYWSLGHQRGLYPFPFPGTVDEEENNLYNRTTTEEFARDSYENVLFSICRFKEYTSNYPLKITVVGYEFKRHRFSNVHRAALLFPEDKFKYVGIDPPVDPDHDLLKEELENALKPFEGDPYGCWNEVLVGKRTGRNPFRVRHGYEVSARELSGLLGWCGEAEGRKGVSQLYKGTLPWI